MASNKVRLKSKTGTILYPETKASIVKNESGQNLGTVEAGAQVNKIETIKVNGTPLQIVSKAVEITIPANAEYSIKKQAIAESGFSATYYLTKNGTQTGEKINIPKDMVVQSGSVKTCETADKPVSGYKVGDKYIDLVLANVENSHVYILVSDLVDNYTAGTAITISGKTIGVNLETLKQTFALKADVDKKATKSTTLSGYGITDAYTKTEVTAELNKKANKGTTLASYGIADAYTKSEVNALIEDLDGITYEEIVEE